MKSRKALLLSALAYGLACSTGPSGSDDGSGGTPPANGTGGGASGGTSGGGATSGNEAGAPAGGTDTGGAPPSDPGDALGAFPFADSPVTRGGTITFSNIGAPGSWPRRLDRPEGDPACDYKDGTDTWGSHCCMTEHQTDSTRLAPFDEEMTLIVKAIEIKQLAIYQPISGETGADWQRVTSWDSRSPIGENLWFTQEGDGSPNFPGDLTHDDCVGYLSQEPTIECGDGSDYYCPNDPGVLHQGYTGSKLVVFLGSMTFDDAGVAGCDGDGAGHPGPWVAFVASELIRDGGRKWNGLCNCYSKTGSVGDGCGEINVFETVLDDNEFSNREFASTGVRSFQAGHVGGSVCGADCARDQFPADADVVDACATTAYETGPEVVADGDSDGCPVWRRPEGDRFFFIALDEAERLIQVGMIHPANIPSGAGAVLPELPGSVARAGIEGLLHLRLPE
jgi:hypothetical protein